MNTKQILILFLIQFVIISSEDVQTLVMNGLIVTGKEEFGPFLGHILIGKN